MVNSIFKPNDARRGRYADRPPCHCIQGGEARRQVHGSDQSGCLCRAVVDTSVDPQTIRTSVTVDTSSFEARKDRRACIMSRLRGMYEGARKSWGTVPLAVRHKERLLRSNLRAGVRRGIEE